MRGCFGHQVSVPHMGIAASPNLIVKLMLLLSNIYKALCVSMHRDTFEEIFLHGLVNATWIFEVFLICLHRLLLL